MLRRLSVVTMLVLVLLMFGAAPSALAHETRAIGAEEDFYVIFGFMREPIYTDHLNGLEVIVQRADDREPVAHLEQSMRAEIIAPDGVTRRQLTLRGVWGEPGVYTADVVLSEPGVYQVRLWGFVNDVQFDETFDTHQVTALEDVKFP